MFLHNLKYAFKTMLKNKLGLIWTVLFPICLGTFMFLAFGNIFETDELFSQIPVAVIEKVPNENFNTVLNSLSGSKDSLLELKDYDEQKALDELDDGKLDAIIYVDEKISLAIKEDNYEVSIVKSILDEYIKNEALIKDILSTSPEKVSEIMEMVMQRTDYHTSKNSSEGNRNPLTNYFFAIFAMSCLFASFTSVEKVNSIQANAGALGLRRSLTPSSKTSLVLAEFTAMLTFQFLALVITLGYFSILGIKFYNIPAILIILLVGSVIGISLGIVVGSVFRVSAAAKQTIAVSISMLMSVMADLCVSGIMNAIEHKCPILNRINPAVLISDSFYSLSVYDNYTRYFRNLSILSGMAVVLLTISILALRRNKYASV